MGAAEKLGPLRHSLFGLLDHHLVLASKSTREKKPHHHDETFERLHCVKPPNLAGLTPKPCARESTYMRLPDRNSNAKPNSHQAQRNIHAQPVSIHSYLLNQEDRTGGYFYVFISLITNLRTSVRTWLGKQAELS